MGFGKALVKKCKMNVKNIPGLVPGSPNDNMQKNMNLSPP